MDEERRALVSARLAKAARKLAAARADIEAARWDEAASRAYYAMFHAARALLAARGVSARTHAGLAAVFADELIRTKPRGSQPVGAACVPCRSVSRPLASVDGLNVALRNTDAVTGDVPPVLQRGVGTVVMRRQSAHYRLR